MDQPLVDMCLFVGKMEECHVAQPWLSTLHPIASCMVKGCWSPRGSNPGPMEKWAESSHRLGHHPAYALFLNHIHLNICLKLHSNLVRAENGWGLALTHVHSQRFQMTNNPMDFSSGQVISARF
jgi:hypothetical protein